MKKKSILISLLLVLLVTLGLMACKKNEAADKQGESLTESAYLAEAAKNNEGMETGLLPVCYTNSSTTSLFEVEKEYDFSALEPNKILETILADLQTIPADVKTNPDMNSVIPEGILSEARLETVIVDSEYGGAVERKSVAICMTELYYDMSLTQRIVMRAGLSRTLFSAGIADQIEFYAPDMYDETADMKLITTSYADDKLIINQYSQDFYTDEVRVHLYFGNEDGTALVRETRTLTMGMTEALPSAIMKALIGGPENEEYTSLIPQGTLVQDIFIKDNVCYVDLSAEFQKNHLGGERSEILTIYSIVNSLQNVSGVRYVQFLIEGERVEYYKSYVKLDSFLTGDLSLMK